MKLLLAIILTATAFNASAKGDTLEETCVQSMIYNISVQVAAHPSSVDALQTNTAGAFSSGNWLGLDPSSTERMISMAKKSEGARIFSKKFQTDPGFAESYRNSYISGCHTEPDKYIVK